VLQFEFWPVPPLPPRASDSMASGWVGDYHASMQRYILALFSDRSTSIVRPEWQNMQVSAATDLEAVKAVTSEYSDALSVCDRAELRSHDGRVIWRLPANA
jgi:hypothetical protein